MSVQYGTETKIEHRGALASLGKGALKVGAGVAVFLVALNNPIGADKAFAESTPTAVVREADDLPNYGNFSDNTSDVPENSNPVQDNGPVDDVIYTSPAVTGTENEDGSSAIRSNKDAGKGDIEDGSVYLSRKPGNTAAGGVAEAAVGAVAGTAVGAAALLLWKKRKNEKAYEKGMTNARVNWKKLK